MLPLLEAETNTTTLVFHTTHQSSQHKLALGLVKLVVALLWSLQTVFLADDGRRARRASISRPPVVVFCFDTLLRVCVLSQNGAQLFLHVLRDVLQHIRHLAGNLVRKERLALKYHLA